MTRQEEIERLLPSLIDAIDAWWTKASKEDATSTLGWIGDDGLRCAARAAMACLECSASAQDKME